MKQNKKVRIGLRMFFDRCFSPELDALVDFAAGASFAQLRRAVHSDEVHRAVEIMRRLGVKRSRAKVREYLTKREYEGWKTMKYIKGEWWMKCESLSL